MRRFFLFFLAGVASLIVSSCLVVEQDLTLERDGSGTKTVTMDLGELFSNPMLAMLSEGEGMPTEVKDSSWVIIDEIRQYNPQWTPAQVAMLERATAEMEIDTEEGIFVVTMKTPFSSLGQLKEIETLMKEANRPEEGEMSEDAGVEKGAMPDFSDFGGAGNNNTEYTLSKKSLSLKTPVSEDIEGMFENLGAGGEGFDMVKGMLEGGAMIYTFHLPGNVKKLKGLEGAEIDGNTVTIALDLLETIEKPEMTAEALTGEIKFK